MFRDSIGRSRILSIDWVGIIFRPRDCVDFSLRSNLHENVRSCSLPVIHARLLIFNIPRVIPTIDAWIVLWSWILLFWWSPVLIGFTWCWKWKKFSRQTPENSRIATERSFLWQTNKLPTNTCDLQIFHQETFISNSLSEKLKQKSNQKVFGMNLQQSFASFLRQ